MPAWVCYRIGLGHQVQGKSTIAGLTASYIKPGNGSIFIDDIDINEISLSSYRSQLGVVLQDDFLFEGTIRENILFSKPDAKENDILEAIKHAHVNEFTDRFLDGLDTLIGERGVKLSGGQRQRLAFIIEFTIVQTHSDLLLNNYLTVVKDLFNMKSYRISSY
jgi:ABC-type bacteriocin/lantibiotic exporters, contain an N-terminal double-glycine peptidase domain